ncbi:uncharacterized protein FIBRA_06497 [Fibroporia radiculosa]|uniref:Uncharacterized protein n=1 Tax=Fibroporia radiculosa TaxID=599839 RepID=J4IBA6_9APHY|nr:uncharacterized protein FIBRA_06497 [Fibroporia radiculosa]CCM04326.1 predicted protein [Fibroporia radiculosa]
MPTVPSTSVLASSFDNDQPLILASAPFSLQDESSGPTPDPELDDVVLVPQEQGNAVTATHHIPLASHQPIKPHLSLENLVLHSPSSGIVGTPFDLSPRFEYPFPDGAEFPDSLPSSVSLPNLTSPFTMLGLPMFLPPSLPLSTFPRPRPDTRGYLSTHPKLHVREPPVPPSLAKKRRIVRDQSPSRHGSLSLGLTAGQRLVQDAHKRSVSLERRLSDETVVSDSSADGRIKPSVYLKEHLTPFVANPSLTLKSSSEVTLVLDDNHKVGQPPGSLSSDTDSLGDSLGSLDGEAPSEEKHQITCSDTQLRSFAPSTLRADPVVDLASDVSNTPASIHAVQAVLPS